VIHAVAQVVTRKLADLTERLQQPCPHRRRFDRHVPRDRNILTRRKRLCGMRHEESGWLNFFDGVGFAPEVAGLRGV
jgi:hypothetical protein